MGVYQVKRRKEKQGANQGDWVEGSPEPMRARGKVVLDGAKSKGVLSDTVRGPGTKSHRTHRYFVST